MRPTTAIYEAAASLLPVVVLLSILNVLPLIFQGLSTFYERPKAHSLIDLSVLDGVRRRTRGNVPRKHVFRRDTRDPVVNWWDLL